MDSLRCWFKRRAWAAVGRRDWRRKSQRKGMDSVNDSGVGRTARQAERVGDVSRKMEAARRPWTVMVPMGAEMDFGTVKRVRRAEVGTVRMISPF